MSYPILATFRAVSSHVVSSLRRREEQLHLSQANERVVATLRTISSANKQRFAQSCPRFARFRAVVSRVVSSLRRREEQLHLSRQGDQVPVWGVGFRRKSYPVGSGEKPAPVL